MLEIDKIYEGDCLELMPEIDDKSIDMILCDLPYGTTACKWDRVIPFEPLWKEYKRLIKDHGAIVLTASQPFTSMLVMSNIEMFKYELVWEKTRPSGFVHSKNKPMKNHENICIFSLATTNHATLTDDRMIYNPQGLIKQLNTRPHRTSHKTNTCFSARPSHKTVVSEYINYPVSIITCSNDNNFNVHPTQKPIALFEYLIKTYTNEGDTVLDNCIGSGTTAIAALNTNRHFIGIEKEPKYVQIARQRITAIPKPLTAF